MEFGRTCRFGRALWALNLSTVCWIITGVNFGVARFGANRGGYVGKSDSWKAGFGIAGNWDCSRRQGSPGSEETFAGGALGLPSDFSVRAETGKMRARWQNSLHPGHPAPVRNFRTTGFSRNSVVGAWGWFTKPRT